MPRRTPLLSFKREVSAAVEHRGDLGLVRVAHEGWQAGQTVRREAIPRCFVSLCLRGSALVELPGGGEGAHLGAGSALLMQRGGTYVLTIERELELLVAVADGAACDRLVADCFDRDEAVVPLGDATGVEALLRLLLDAVGRPGPHPREFAEHGLDLLLRQLHRASLLDHEAATGARATFLACRRVLDEHARDLASVSAAAARCHVDRAYLSRLFQRFARCAPGAYLTRLKMQLASQALLAGAGVAQAATAAGYGDAFTFSKAFRRHFGQAPSRWQQTLLAGD